MPAEYQGPPTEPDAPEWVPVKQMTTCPDGHEYPIMAGECPYDHEPTAAFLEEARRTEDIDRETTRSLLVSVPDDRHVPALLRDWFHSGIVALVDNGRVPRTQHQYGYTKYIGAVHHIPVAPTLAALTRYFRYETAEAPQGSTHFGIGRDFEWTYRIPGTHTLFGCATVHQYVPLRGVSPWAQGVIARSDWCTIPPTPVISGMRPGEPNGAFASVENVAMKGSDGVTDPQFNANVLLRAYLAALDGYEITPRTQLWHSEIDQLNRCNDPGWTGALEDEMQEAARRLLRGDLSLVRGRWSDAPAPAPPPPPPPPAPKPVVGRETRIEPIGAASVVVDWTDKDDERLITTRQRVRLVRDA